MFVGHFRSRFTTLERTSDALSGDHDYNFGEEDTEPAFPLTTSLSRTSLLILDYKQFLAARRIQCYWRGYHARKLRVLRWKAAVTIQRWWRGFRVRHLMTSDIETRLQNSIVEHYHRAATKIQALFRGWWVRQTVHDMYSLRRMQVCAAEELLHCVAFKLHHLLRTYSIPGVYSLRNSHCLSRVEKMLASISFRFYNERVRGEIARRLAQSDMHRREFKAAKFQTPTPYPGPNFNKVCPPQCEDYLMNDRDMDRRLFKVIEEYEKSQEVEHVKKFRLRQSERKRRQHISDLLARQDKHKRNFCGDVLESMRKWNVWDGRTIKIDKDLFRNEKNLDKFLNEISDYLKEIENLTCHCRIKQTDELICH